MVVNIRQQGSNFCDLQIIVVANVVVHLMRLFQ